MKGKPQLGEFLRTRRSQLRPEELGVPTYGERRRVPGLRREELALLAGVLPAHFSGHSALEVEHHGSGFAIKRWAPISRN